MTGPLEHVLVAHAKDCFRSQEYLTSNWRSYGFLFEPSFDDACRESDQFIGILADSGARIEMLPEELCIGLDSIYVRDPLIACGPGFLSGSMGKELRRGEPASLASCLSSFGMQATSITDPSALIEGGDIVWLRPDVVAVGEGFRTNRSGIDALTAFCGDSVSDVIAVPAPYWNGADDVLHLMSMVSPLSTTHLLVHSRLMPVPFRQELLNLGFTLLEVPQEEYDILGCNVLALDESTCLVEMQNIKTIRMLSENGWRVLTYDGRNISQAGQGGPTCLTRPLKRSR